LRYPWDILELSRGYSNDIARISQGYLKDIPTLHFIWSLDGVWFLFGDGQDYFEVFLGIRAGEIELWKARNCSSYLAIFS